MKLTLSYEDDIFESALPTDKPDKENCANHSYSFPNYLDRKSAIKISPTGDSTYNRIEYVEHISASQANAGKYTIKRDRILTDSRTACMIKNIPNKYTSAMLIRLINETHFCTYDFFYLRIDFKNRCNVGYAFINFINNEHVLTFYDRIHGMKWRSFSSSKIAELSYASIQGIENLKEKFKRSAVMQEDRSYRPKLFYTAGWKRGLEKEEFE